MTELLLASLFIFVLAVFVGYEIIQKVPQTLHTPLMSGSNAISGITVVGALAIVLIRSDATSWLAQTIGFMAITLASINVVGGFLVTDRMLKMFRRR
ncbi:MAG: NAD(P) transhydrogenase subunit alpha [Phycisphaeraceae bacterium]|nr:MAG: NAD(P) transhydrogenase subunit alpha [Phycisphaeraceae bacterium]